MKTFVCWILRPFQRWWGDLCVCFCFLCVCCFASGFTFPEMLSRKKKLRTKLLWNLFQEMVAFGGERRNSTRRLKGRKNRLQWHFNVLKMSWFLWVNKVVEKYYVISFECEWLWHLLIASTFSFATHRGDSYMLIFSHKQRNGGQGSDANMRMLELK